MARTHSSIHTFILGCIGVLAFVGATACDNTARGVKQDAKQAEEQTRDERAQAKDKAREIGDDVARAANRAGEAASQAGEELAERASATYQTIDVKGALMADSSVDATRISVHTDYKTKTVTLSGYTPTETERNMAEVIAKARAEGYTIVNNIQVKPRQ